MPPGNLSAYVNSPPDIFQSYPRPPSFLDMLNIQKKIWGFHSGENSSHLLGHNTVATSATSMMKEHWWLLLPGTSIEVPVGSSDLANKGW